MKCEWCVRRPLLEGGNGTCPILHRRTIQVLAPGSLKTREEREPIPDAWKRHLTVYPSGCDNFKAGDLVPRKPPVEQESLF